MQGKCPACRAAMEVIADPKTQLELDCCPECHGLWFDADELRKFYSSDKLKARLMPSQTYKPSSHTFEITTKARRCPRCPQELTRTQVGDIFVDICPQCSGVWLDDGELDRLTHTYKNQGLKGDSRVTDQVRHGNRVGGDKPTTAVGELMNTLGSVFSTILGMRLK